MLPPEAPAGEVPVVPAAPVSPTPAPATPATPPAEDRNRDVTKSEVTDLFRRLADTVEEPEKKAEEPADVPEKKPAAPEKKPAEKPVRIHKTPALSKRPPLPKDEPVRPAAALPPVAAAAAPIAPATEELFDNEKDMITQAKLVEDMLGESHKGLGAKMEKFIRVDHAKYLKDHPEVEEGDADAKSEYDAWLAKNMPQISPGDLEKAKEERTVKRVRGEYEKELDTVRHEQFVRDETPRIEREVQQHVESIFQTALPDEILAVIKDKKHGGDINKGAKEANELYGDEIAVASRIIKVASDDIAELMRVSTVNPKTRQPLASAPTAAEPERMQQHMRINNMINAICTDFEQTAQEKELVDPQGRWFVTREQWFSLPPAERPKFWTFDNKQVIERAKRGIKSVVAEGIRLNSEEMKKRGYVREKRVAAAPAGTPPPASSSPAPRPSPVPGSRPAGAPSVSSEAQSLAATFAKDA